MFRAFRVEMDADQFGARTLTFREFRACGPPEYFRKKGPITRSHWIVDMESVYRMSF